MRARRAHVCRAFSLVEILIVVMILGILAAIAIPKFANASSIARENALKEDLRLVRTQLGVYKTQHVVYPGYPGGDDTQTPTAQIASDQILLYTDSAGNTSPTASAAYKWGPYIGQLPINPVNGLSDWKILSPTDALAADGATGWLYQPSTGQFHANVVGADTAGNTFVNY